MHPDKPESPPAQRKPLRMRRGPESFEDYWREHPNGPCPLSATNNFAVGLVPSLSPEEELKLELRRSEVAEKANSTTTD